MFALARRAMVPTSVVVCFGVALVIGVVAARYFVRYFCHPCHHCSRRTVFFKRLDESEKREILQYFQGHEHRTPDTARLAACRHCLLVFDDFLGVTKGLEAEHIATCKVCGGTVVCMGMQISTGRMGAVREANPHLLASGIECLTCRRNPLGWLDCLQCDTPAPLYACSQCSAVYASRSLEEGRYAFFAPLT